MSYRIASIVAALATLVSASGVLAGPLVPPTGPITSTGKTLTEIEPRVGIGAPSSIIGPGSYYLTGNITAAAGASNAIVIDASNVVLDLNGFNIIGAQTGIRVNSFATNVTIRNGTVRSTTGSGIFSDNFFSVQASNVRVENVTLTNITDAAIFLGAGSVISNVTVDTAGANGIVVGPGSTITNTRVTNVLGASPSGIGVIAGVGSILQNVSSRNNANCGAIVEADGLVTECNFSSNTVHGIIMGSNTRLSNSTIAGNGNTGVVLENPNSIGALSCVVENNSISSNARYGIAQFIAGNALIRNNMVSRNGDFGIRVEDNSQVIGNRIAENGTMPLEGGLVVNGSGNLIQGNSFSLNFGFSWNLQSPSSACTIIANTNRGSGGIVNGTGHVIAPVTSAATAVSGSNPNVNIQY